MLIPGVDAITRPYRHMQRYREIIMVLLKHGFGEFVTKLGLHRHVRVPAAGKGESEESPGRPSREKRFRMVLEELGPTFVKLGQILSTRRDALPDAVTAELEKLQDHVAPFPSEQSREIITRELGKPVEELFQRFEDTPLASASIAQVHDAITAGGDHVVVKVQRPDIVRTIETDLEIMAHLAGLVERFIEGARVLEPVNIVGEFTRLMHCELDFGAEAAHMERMSRNFADDPRLHVPVVHRELTAMRVLTMEHIDGTKLSRLAELEESGIDSEEVAALAVELMFQQVFVHGFYHADLHPGNILVQPGPVLCFLDFGVTKILTARYREQLSSLILGLVNRNERQIANAVFRLSGYSHYERTERIEQDLANFAEEQLYRPLRQVRMGEVLNQLTRLLVVHDIHMPTDFFFLTKALTTAEGTARQMYPDLDITAQLEPFARKLLRERLSLKRTLAELVPAATEMQALLRDLPTDAREILAMLKRGEMRVNFEHSGLDGLIRTQDQISNRTVFAIVLAALIIGSSLMVLSDIPPRWHGVPVIGVGGFIVSGLVGFALLYSMIRHRKL